MKPSFVDLVDRPHEPLRCLGYVRAALARIFPSFRPSDLPSTEDEVVEWLQSPASSSWTQIGKKATAATRLGDLLYGSSREGEDYVAVLIDPVGGGFLTSTPERGCHVRPRRTLKGVRSVQRMSR